MKLINWFFVLSVFFFSSLVSPSFARARTHVMMGSGGSGGSSSPTFFLPFRWFPPPTLNCFPVSCFLIPNHYCVLACEQVATFSSAIFKKRPHMSHVTCPLLPYLTLSYRSRGCPLPPSAEPHRPAGPWEHQNPKNPDRHNPNAGCSATHSDRITKATSASNSAGSIILFPILNRSIRMGFESE